MVCESGFTYFIVLMLELLITSPFCANFHNVAQH